MNGPDDELRARLSKLRRRDVRRAPEFRAMLTDAAAGTRTVRARRAPALLWVAAAAGVVLVTGMAVRWEHDRDPLPTRVVLAPSRDTLQTITNWKSPTAGFLRTTGSRLLVPPAIHSSILDGAAPTPVQRKGA